MESPPEDHHKEDKGSGGKKGEGEPPEDHHKEDQGSGCEDGEESVYSFKNNN